MEYILTSNQHEIKNNCLRYTFQKPDKVSKSMYIINKYDIL